MSPSVGEIERTTAFTGSDWHVSFSPSPFCQDTDQIPSPASSVDQVKALSGMNEGV